MAFGDVFAGYQEAAAGHWQNVLQMDYQNKRSIAEQYAKIAEDPRYDEETQREAQKRSLHVLTHAPGDKLPKEYEEFTFQRKPPAPVNVPGTPGTSGTDEQGMPQAATAATQPQTVQAPAPPPGPMGPMPFAQQVERMGQTAEAKAQGQYGIAGLKASIPHKVDAQNIQGEDGRRYKEDIYQYRNAATGQMEQFNIRQDAPLAFFAPRSGATDTAGSLAHLSEQYGFMVLDTNGKPMDISKLAQENPNQLFQHIGEDRYVPVAEKKDLRNIGGFQTPYGPISGTVGAPVGLSQGSLPTNRQTLVPIPGGGIGKTTLTTTRGTQNPAGFTPTLPPIPPLGAPSGAPAPTAPPISQSVPRRTQEIPASPVAPPQPQGGVTPIPGAGRGLTAEQVIDQSKKAEAFSNTIDRTMGIMDAINDPSFGFNDFLKRAKIAIDSNPTTPIAVIIANMAKVSPKEAKFVADFTSLAEDINVLRSTYGATGFRGAEAFSVLLGQRGNIMGNPAIFKETLKNTLQSVVSQFEPIAQGLSRSGEFRQVTPGTIKAYAALGEKTAIGPNGELGVRRGGKWIDVITGKPVK